jgi:hypothetical protein
LWTFSATSRTQPEHEAAAMRRRIHFVTDLVLRIGGWRRFNGPRSILIGLLVSADGGRCR